jgi:hypothetical protein
LKPTVHENLSVITAGEHPQNPSELIGNDRFELLVNTLRTMADFIIFDSPALLPVSDGMIMAPKIDACIMVVRALWTPMKAAQQAKNQLKRIGCNIIGGILNGISHSRGYYPYYYGYYRYYAYKYTYEDDHDRDRRKFSVRELGLKVENGAKAFLRAGVFSFPRYSAKIRSFLRHLFGQKIFWLLVVLLCAIPVCFIVLKFFGVGKNSRDITYLGNRDSIQYVGVSPSPQGGASLERIGAGQPVPAFSAVSGTGRSDNNLLSSLSDSLRLWQQSFNTGNSGRYLSFYDMVRFKFPGGSYQEWESVTKGLFNRQNGASRLAIDSIWADSVALPFYQTNFSLSFISAGDTLHRIYNTVWQNSNNHWRIIREKYR